ncbi:MAG: hypothetical protein RLY93_12075 [Sumerlaeia bacterium]
MKKRLYFFLGTVSFVSIIMVVCCKYMSYEMLSKDWLYSLECSGGSVVELGNYAGDEWIFYDKYSKKDVVLGLAEIRLYPQGYLVIGHPMTGNASAPDVESHVDYSKNLYLLFDKESCEYKILHNESDLNKLGISLQNENSNDYRIVRPFGTKEHRDRSK